MWSIIESPHKNIFPTSRLNLSCICLIFLQFSFKCITLVYLEIILMYDVRYRSNFIFLQVNIQSLSIIYINAHLFPSDLRCRVAIPVCTWVNYRTYYSLPLSLFFCRFHSIFIREVLQSDVVFLRASPPLLLIFFKIFLHIIVSLFFYMDVRMTLHHSGKKFTFTFI